MKQSYPDIHALTTAAPLWYDANGTPRYAPHHPELCPDIYADTVALIAIECQSCQHEFLVQVSTKRRAGHAIYWQQPYGDPPSHEDDGAGGVCASGSTMTSVPVRIVEFWTRSGGDWQRDSAQEGRDIRPEWSKEDISIERESDGIRDT